MDDLTGFSLNEKYKRFQSVGDKLAEIESLIDWKYSLYSRIDV